MWICRSMARHFHSRWIYCSSGRGFREMRRKATIANRTFSTSFITVGGFVINCNRSIWPFPNRRTLFFFSSKPIASSSRQKYNIQAWHENVLVWARSPNSQPCCLKLCSAELSFEHWGSKVCSVPGCLAANQERGCSADCVLFSGRAQRSVFCTGLKVRACCFHMYWLSLSVSHTRTACSHGNSCFVSDVEGRSLYFLQRAEVWNVSTVAFESSLFSSHSFSLSDIRSSLLCNFLFVIPLSSKHGERQWNLMSWHAGLYVVRSDQALRYFSSVDFHFYLARVQLLTLDSCISKTTVDSSTCSYQQHRRECF